ncbi:hypothetical protein [Pedobacter polysacchareus]|uniref:hypothetical protein n=1 Tax=Pedobacter polysacchareus TaxID=2861973 RepID=UPI001C991A4B|nr:hypothetical protein [Pedobacter polysacchareus]
MNNNTILKKNFRNSIRRGTGEAYLIMLTNPNLDFSNDIIKGCLTNFAYDGQCENSRGVYLSELISLTRNRDKIRNAILIRLANEQSDTWTLTQLFDLASIFAQNGDVDARKAIYERFFSSPIEGSDWVGYSEILELDGMEGMKFIAEKMGRGLEINPEDWQDDSIIRHFQDDNPSINVLKELEKLAVENRFIQIYLKNVKKTNVEAKSYKRVISKYKDIIDEVLASKPYIRLFNRQLTDEELNSVAKRLLVEENIAFQEKLLYVFTEFKFPLESGFILSLAKQKLSSENRIAEFAIDALKLLKSDAIRQFAIERIKTARIPQMFTNIFISNYEVGDGIFLKELAMKFNNEHVIENLAVSYIEIYRANKTKECKEPLEILYGKMNCGIHRKDIIELLIKNGVLSERLKEEIKYDSYLDSRELLENA